MSAHNLSVDFQAPVGKRRPGDPARLVALADKIKNSFNWQPCHSDLKTIVASAWRWQKNFPQGYE